MKKLFSKSFIALIISTVIFQASVFAQSKNTPQIGDKGPGGGIIFYINGKTAYECSELYYEEDWESAVDLCERYKGGRKSDWYLPTKVQLNRIYENLVKPGIINSNSWYWSSTCHDNYESAWVQRFSDGKQDTGAWDLNKLSIIAVRDFDVSEFQKNNNRQTETAETSSSGYDGSSAKGVSIKIGDKGPGGGTVFLIEGKKAYECSDPLGVVHWVLAENFCKKFRGGGYSDWSLPTQEQLNYIYKNLKQTGIISDNTRLWSSKVEVNSNTRDKTMWAQYFDNGKQQQLVPNVESIVRAVRVFDIDDFKKNGNKTTISFEEACANFYTYPGATDFAKKGLTPKIGDIGPGGGIVFYVGNHIAYECSDLIGWANWEEAKKIAKDFRGGGYSDWSLPTQDELNYIYKNLLAGKFNAYTDYYWSSTPCYEDRTLAMAHYFKGGYLCTNYKDCGNFILAIRSFKY